MSVPVHCNPSFCIWKKQRAPENSEWIWVGICTFKASSQNVCWTHTFIQQWPSGQAFFFFFPILWHWKFGEFFPKLAKLVEFTLEKIKSQLIHYLHFFRCVFGSVLHGYIPVLGRYPNIKPGYHLKYHHKPFWISKMWFFFFFSFFVCVLFQFSLFLVFFVLTYIVFLFLCFLFCMFFLYFLFFLFFFAIFLFYFRSLFWSLPMCIFLHFIFPSIIDGLLLFLWLLRRAY
jgi:hypothetical protein